MVSEERDRLQQIDFIKLSQEIKEIESAQPNSELLNVLKGSAELTEYKHSLSQDLTNMEESLLRSYMESSDSFLSLYRQTLECDIILNSMESTLLQFADSLRGVSDEIRQLQDKSEDLSAQLKSRSETQERLISFVDAAVVSPDLVNIICEEEDCCSPKFLSAIVQLGRKIRAHSSLDPELPAVIESSGEIQKLKMKAVSRIRDFILAQLSFLKQTKPNFKGIQYDKLLQAKPLIEFLRDLDGGVFFLEVANCYLSGASKFYQSSLKTYVQSLSKLPLEPVAAKTDLLGAMEGGPGDSPSQSAPQVDLMSRLKLTGLSSASITVKGNTFSLGGREKIITEDLNSEILQPSESSSSAQNIRYYPEAILRSHQKLLTDAASHEASFLKDFFSLSESEIDQQRFFESVFGKTLSWLSDQIVSSQIKDSFDAVGLILSVRIVEHFEDSLVNRQKISGIESYFENLLSQLRMRLRYIVEQHTESLKRIDVKRITQPLSVTSPFFITRRFAEFAAALLFVRSQLSAEDAQLSAQIESLLTTYDAFLSALSKKFPSNLDQQIYQLNNLDLVVSIFRERQLKPDSMKRFEEKMNLFVSVFVEKKLTESFGPLIKLTVEQERLGGTPNASLSDLERMVLQFQQNWKVEAGKIQKEIAQSFSNYATGSEIVKSAMTQLLLYYTRFQKIITIRLAGQSPAWARQIVPSAVIMAEIKQLQNLF